MKIENDNTTLELEVPNESHAIVRIPLVADDVLFTPNTDIKELEKDELYRYYQMESGKWSIVYQTNMLRWVSPQCIKETFVPATDYMYPNFMED